MGTERRRFSKMFKLSPEIKDVGSNSRKFVFKNLKHFKEIFFPLVPYLLITDILAMYLEPHGFWVLLPVNILQIYIWAVLAISWHKLVIMGESAHFKTSFWSVKNHEFLFFRTWLFIGFGALLALAPLYFFEDLIGVKWVILIFLGIYYWVILRISLFFPAAAVGKPIKMKKAFEAGKGLPHKIFFSTIYATLRLLFIWLLYALAIVGVNWWIMASWLEKQYLDMDEMMEDLMSGESVEPIASSETPSFQDFTSSFWFQAGEFISEIPVNYFFDPIMTVIGVSVVSNYYLRTRSNF